MKIIFILIFFPVLCFSQNNYLEIQTYFGLQPTNMELQYVSFNQEKLSISNCKDFRQCANKTPEELLQSLLSARNYEWDKVNYSYEIYKNKDYNTKSDTDFFQLHKKLSFSIGAEKYCVMKYLIVTEDKELPSATVMKINNGVWQVISPKQNMTSLMMMFKYLSPIALDGIFLQKSIGIPSFDEMVTSVYLNKTLQLSKALKVNSNKAYTDDETKIILGSSNHFEVKDKTVKAEILFLINQQSLYKYVDASYYGSKKDTLVNTLISKLDVPTEAKVTPIFRFNFEYNNQNFIILKVNSVVQGNEETLQPSIFIKRSNNWVLYKDTSSDVLTTLNTIMMKSDITLLESLNKINPKEHVLIVNKVRNSDDYIDINKLIKI